MNDINQKQYPIASRRLVGVRLEDSGLSVGALFAPCTKNTRNQLIDEEISV